MDIKIKVMTIAILFEDGTGSVDTYPYLVDDNSNSSFIDKFMSIYGGNGIETVTVLKASQEHEFKILDFDSMETIKNTLKEIYPTMNETLIH